MKKLQYNSPVILTFFSLRWLHCCWALPPAAGPPFICSASTARRWRTLCSIFRLMGHILGHAGWQHFLGNMLLLLVVGPPLEEKYGSRALLAGIGITAVLSGILHVFFPGAALLGASGIVFMLIMLASLSGMRSGQIPLTLLLVAALYLGQQVYDILFVRDNVANFMHIVGGACGTGFGFAAARRR